MNRNPPGAEMMGLQGCVEPEIIIFVNKNKYESLDISNDNLHVDFLSWFRVSLARECYS